MGCCLGSGDVLGTVVAAGRQECESDEAVKAIGRFGGKEVCWNATCSRGIGGASKGRKGSEKARRIRLSALLLLLAGKRQGNDQSTGEESRGSDHKVKAKDTRRIR